MTPEQEKARQHWKYRVVQATKGNTSLLGAVVLGILGKMARRPPWVAARATIGADGVVRAQCCDRNGREGFAALFTSVEDMAGQFSRLADELKLEDAERIELFQQVKLWCARDLRPEGQRQRLTFHATRSKT